MRFKILNWIVRQLPKEFVYHCGLRIWVTATTGEYSSTVVPEITMQEALDRFYSD
jgi:hypothetical protein